MDLLRVETDAERNLALARVPWRRSVGDNKDRTRSHEAKGGRQVSVPVAITTGSTGFISRFQRSSGLAVVCADYGLGWNILDRLGAERHRGQNGVDQIAAQPFLVGEKLPGNVAELSHCLILIAVGIPTDQDSLDVCRG